MPVKYHHKWISAYWEWSKTVKVLGFLTLYLTDSVSLSVSVCLSVCLPLSLSLCLHHLQKLSTKNLKTKTWRKNTQCILTRSILVKNRGKPLCETTFTMSSTFSVLSLSDRETRPSSGPQRNPQNKLLMQATRNKGMVQNRTVHTIQLPSKR